ncbi:MAG: IS1380 family transposase [Acidobacteria bacterium]|nr:IS1380 family transposase [Acidobacteriota bacterium]
MVKDQQQDSPRTPVNQGVRGVTPEPNRIGASTPYDFEGRNLTAYGGLLPVATMLEKLGFRQLVEETLTVKRRTRAMTMYRFVLAMVLACYVGFSRLFHLRFLEREPMLTGILGVLRLPPQCTFWRFLASLHLAVARQLLQVQQRMRQRVWEAAHVQLTEVTLDTDTTVHTLFGQQMGGRKSYNPKNRGKKSYQPILTFLAETKEYVAGALRTGDRPSGKEIAAHLDGAYAALPATVKTVYARADSGFYCWEAVQAYEKRNCRFVLVARKTARLVDQLKAAEWKSSPRTDADGQCEFCYQPEGWGQAYRFLALRYEKQPAAGEADAPEQYQLFETSEYTFRVFVTNMDAPLDALVGFYRGRATAENLIKEANNDAGLTAHPSKRWMMNANWFQMVMLAYNLNCWLLLFNREEHAKVEQMPHTTLATARLRFLFLAAKIWRHAGRVGVRYSDHYEEKGLFERLMNRLRSIAAGAGGFRPVIATALRC